MSSLLDRRRESALVVFSGAGVAIAGYLSWVAVEGPDAIVCGPGNCGAVQSSEYAEIGTVPVAMLGLTMYVLLLLLAVVRRFRDDAPRVTGVWIFSLALAGTAYSAYLTYVELFVIDAICSWCVASALVVTATFVLALPEIRASTDDREGGRPPDAEI